MNGALLANDLKTLQGVKDTVAILQKYLQDELEVAGHTYTVALALVNGVQVATKLWCETAELEQQLIKESGEVLNLRLEA